MLATVLSTLKQTYEVVLLFLPILNKKEMKLTREVVFPRLQSSDAEIKFQHRSSE